MDEQLQQKRKEIQATITLKQQIVVKFLQIKYKIQDLFK